eukprot:3546050-Rhodomonas_salina.1
MAFEFNALEALLVTLVTRARVCLCVSLSLSLSVSLSVCPVCVCARARAIWCGLHAAQCCWDALVSDLKRCGRPARAP